MHGDIKEIAKFNNLAHEWWDIEGQFKTLHHINPIRLKFVKSMVELNNKSIIDIGCGGGIFSEALARDGAKVTGIDLAKQSIEIAKLHLFESNLDISYECTDIEDKAATHLGQFDSLVCMEMLEHVTNPEAIIHNCSKLIKLGGFAFFSTVNRNFKSYALGIVAAEYLLNIVPRGTHEYTKFIKPSELRSLLEKHRFSLEKISGIQYNPITQKAKLGDDISINYIVGCRKIC